MIAFKQIAATVWGGGSYPMTFVITKNPSTGLFVASARDANDPLQRLPRNNLGHQFETLEEAQDACREFLIKQKKIV